jgi:prepilin-type N-terminal cleavage/methylation domain-containing protein
MFIKPQLRSVGYTLIEMMVGVALFSIVSAAVCSAYMFSLRSFQALSNYNILDQQNRQAVDIITREVRQANSVQTYDNVVAHKITLVDGNLNPVTYTFNRYTQQLTRTANGATTVLLNNCSLLNFNLGMRPPNTNYGYYPTTDVNKAKIVDLSWKTSRGLFNGVQNSEDIQTARIVIRKQKVSQ